MKITTTLLLLLFCTQLLAQDTIKLNEKTFESMSTTAMGKAIVYSQRNVQLKKAGKYFVKHTKGEMFFRLNKNFYVDGNFYSKYYPQQSTTTARYVNGTRIFEQTIAKNFKLTAWTAVENKGKDYFTTNTTVNKQDSTIEQYQNKAPLLKEKYRAGRLVFKNDMVSQIVTFYDNDGRLAEKHEDKTQEKYNYNGEVYFKKIYLKGGFDEYNNGKLSKTARTIENADGSKKYITTIYDREGNELSASSEDYVTYEVAPEYMIFELREQDFKAYKEVGDAQKSKD